MSFIPEIKIEFESRLPATVFIREFQKYVDAGRYAPDESKLFSGRITQSGAVKIERLISPLIPQPVSSPEITGHIRATEKGSIAELVIEKNSGAGSGCHIAFFFILIALCIITFYGLIFIPFILLKIFMDRKYTIRDGNDLKKKLLRVFKEIENKAPSSANIKEDLA